ncbi:low molecular weight protein-tyrosine-phosphatase [Sphingobium chlorophenolicum]|uniref:protein-tyrosine-phosphatase n=1 Tax=Sphingobium chlorophenolicum TaxID=46429 RepID=A0A081R8D1_SPHCR|nr:low molecular weight protein-tyrosine-phosphatase [Sphingobium chlorophenolicum]KEQ51454.1 Phosphotyrosine protein phosphatase [Sphingobium chlorophenolicum]
MTASVLFVCLGNICRSPLAEAALRAQAERAGVEIVVDSAGTGDWHVGSPPDPRAQAVALRHGIDISGYRGRQVTAADFRRFTHVFPLDAENLRNLRRVRPADGTAELRLLMDLVPGREGSGVTDPYFGDDAGFDVTWDDVTRAAEAILERLRG